MDTVRGASAPDIEDILTAWAVSMPYDPVSRSALEAFLSNPRYCQTGSAAVAEKDGEAVGFAAGIAAEENAGWIPVFFVRPDLAGGRLADDLLDFVLEYLKRRGVTYVRAEPFEWSEARFFTGIDSRYSHILDILERRGFVRTDESQVDIVKDLRDFRPADDVAAARLSLEREGFTFTLCDEVTRRPYLEFLDKYFERYQGWRIGIRRQLEAGDLARHTLALLSGEVVGFCAFDKETDWYIWASGVREDLRLKGIGTILVYLALEEITRRGAERMLVSDCPIEFYKILNGRIERHYVMLGRKLGGAL